jgi:serine/threonine protein kinase
MGRCLYFGRNVTQYTSFTRCVGKINGGDKHAIQHIHIEYSNFLFPIIGNSTLNQVEKILEISDPSKVRSGTEKLSSPIAKLMLDSVRVHRHIRIEDLIRNVALNGSETTQRRQKSRREDAIDFLKRMLAFDPQERYSAEMALSHGYLSDFHNPAYEPEYYGRPVCSRNVLDDNTMFPVDRYRIELEAKSINFANT